MNLLPNNDSKSIITKFKPAIGQWGLTEDNITRIDPETGGNILHNYCQFIGSTPIEVFDYLILTRRVDLNLIDKNDGIPFYYALSHTNPFNNDHVAVLTHLLSQSGLNVNTKCKYGYTLLHWVCLNLSVVPFDVFKCLVEIQNANFQLRDESLDSPLHIAFQHFGAHIDNGAAILIYLLSQDSVDPNIKNAVGGTLVHAAYENINAIPIDVYKALFSIKGVDINSLDDDQNTPIYLAIGSFNAKYGGDISVLTYLLNQDGIDINHRNKFGSTLLQYACFDINSLPLDAFKHLIEINGADVNALNNDDQNPPLCNAIHQFQPTRGGDITTLTYLINKTRIINTNTTTQPKLTVLHMACIRDLLPSHSSREVYWHNNTTKEEVATIDTYCSQIVEILVEKCLDEILNQAMI
jgi:ankyrin repeat protein